MKFEVVRLGLVCACMNYSVREARLLGSLGACHPRKSLVFRPSEVVSDAILSRLLRISLLTTLWIVTVCNVFIKHTATTYYSALIKILVYYHMEEAIVSRSN